MKLEAIKLTRKFGATTALDAVSFRLEPGEIVGFAGPNGAGKTTALRILAGRDLPDSGDVVCDGVSLCEYPEKCLSKIGFMPDALDSSKNTGVAEHLDLALRLRGLAGKARQEAFAEIVGQTGIETMLENTIASLSKGMRQRVSLARMLAADPQYLLLDEPAAGLDPRARVELRDLLRELAGRGKAVFLSSHILAELDDLCDRVIIIKKGRIREFAEPCEIPAKIIESVVISSALPAKKFAERLAGRKGVRSAVPENRNRVRVELQPDIRPAVFVAGLIAEGEPVTGFEQEGNDLESRFLQATGKGETK